jgi:PAS domain S-box-containing protein
MSSITIRKKTLLIIFATTLFLLLLLYGISETFFLNSFANLEDQEVLENVGRAQLALSSDIDQLNSTVQDWAAWNDTYAFIVDRNQNYISANLNAESLSNLRLNLVLFVDSSGQLVFARMLNLDTKKETPVPQNFLKNLFKKGTLVCRNESDMFKGIVLLPEGSLLISSQPILTSEGNGPVRGTLIMGRYLDSELTHLSDLTQLPIVSQRINDSNMSSDFAAAQSSILKDKPVLVNPLSENSIAGYVLIKDIYGDPTLILRVDLPRDIYRQGQSAIYYFSIYILLIGLIFAIVILFLLEKTFLSRIARLILDVRNIGLSGDVSMRIPVAGKDELSSLSCNINDMLDKIDQSITERKQIEKALQESEEKYRLLIDTANESVIVAQDGLFKFVNPMTLGLLGADSEQELIDRPFPEFIHTDDRSMVVENYRRRIANGASPPRYSFRVVTRDGIVKWVEINAALIEWQGKPATLNFLTDITERKRAEEALRKAHDELEMRVKERTEELTRKNTEMERFIYTVSHDLRTPLISVSGLLGFLKQDAEKGDLERMNADFRMANEAITNMDQLLMETLELSRIGRVVNPPEDVPFGEIVEDALGQTSEKIRSKGFKVSVDQNLPVVHVDRMRITEVLVNLIENSLKYMGLQANPEIEIGQRIDGMDRIFFVRDNGIGIDPSQHDKVFELFYKVDKKSEGTGAGLAIVKRIIEVHGGSIWIESEMGQGCTVCFTLPLANVG